MCLRSLEYSFRQSLWDVFIITAILCREEDMLDLAPFLTATSRLGEYFWKFCEITNVVHCLDVWYACERKNKFR